MGSVLNGRYGILNALGEGGVAIVYRAHDSLLDRTVAVKILRQHFASDPLFLARFRREAQAAARLSHPNIIAIYDVGEDNGQHYIVMEYVEGRNLKSVVTEDGPLPAAKALYVAEQVCAALEHAHRQGFVHRDVKPQNILVRDDGRGTTDDELRTEGEGRRGREYRLAAGARPGLVVKVADFGLARSLNGAAASESGIVFGTVQYISPEQARGEAATPASDIYSLGVVLYEMLTGRLPFESDTPIGLALKHIQEEPTPPSRLNAHLPATLDGYVLRAMAKDAGARFASAGEMGAALAAYRQLGEEATSRLRPVRPQPAPALQPAVSPASVGARRATPTRRGFDWFLLVLFLVTLAATVGLVPLALNVRDAVFPAPPTPLPQVQVPALVRLQLSVAEEQLRALGLRLVVQDERFDEQVPIGHIVAQLIAAGTWLPQGEGVEVIVSRGKEPVAVPGVVGLAFAEAQARLTTRGLQVERRDAPSAQAPAGTVVAQDPAADTEVERGSLVRLTVSIGDRVVVPNLVGRLEAEAQQAIREAGLQTTYVNYQSPEDVPPQFREDVRRMPSGMVISQEPTAGTLVERGTVVMIAVRR